MQRLSKTSQALTNKFLSQSIRHSTPVQQAGIAAACSSQIKMSPGTFSTSDDGHDIITTMLSVFDLVGLVGIALSIGCYARVQWHRDYAKKLSYSVLNFLSAVLLGVSILHNWNLSSFIGNAFWLLISVYGIYRCLKFRFKENSKQFSQSTNSTGEQLHD